MPKLVPLWLSREKGEASRKQLSCLWERMVVEGGKGEMLS